MSENPNTSKTPTRKTLLNRITRTGAALQTLGRKTNELRWSIAEDLYLLQGTYPQGDEGAAAFKAAAATASGLNEDSIRNLVRAVVIRNGLTPVQRAAVEGWPYDSVLSLAPSKEMTATRQTALIKKVPNGQTKDVRREKAAIIGKKRRTRKTSADETVALAKKVQKDVTKLLKNGHNPLAIAAGCRLARTYPTGDVAAAVLFIAAQAKKVPATA